MVPINLRMDAAILYSNLTELASGMTTLEKKLASLNKWLPWVKARHLTPLQEAMYLVHRVL